MSGLKGSSQPETEFSTLLPWFRYWIAKTYPPLTVLVDGGFWFKIASPAGLLVIFVGLYNALVELLGGQQNQTRHLDLYLDAASIFIDILNLGVLSGLLAFVVMKISTSGSNPSLNVFKVQLALLTSAWLTFYLARFFIHAETIAGTGAVSQLLEYVLPIANLTTALLLFSIYILLMQRPPATSITSKQGFWLAAGAVGLCMFYALFAIASGLLPGATSGTSFDHQKIADILNGLLVGSATALVVGRLNSKFLNLRQGTIVALFIYSIIQPLYPFIHGGDRLVELAVIGFALFAKTLFLLVAAFVLDTGRLQFYLHEIRWFDRHVDQRRRWFVTKEAATTSDFLPSPPGLVTYSWKLERGVLDLNEKSLRFKVLLRNFGIGPWLVSDISCKSVQLEGLVFERARASPEDKGPILDILDIQRLGRNAKLDLEIPDESLIERGEKIPLTGLDCRIEFEAKEVDRMKERVDDLHTFRKRISESELDREDLADVRVRLNGCGLRLSRSSNEGKWHWAEAMDGSSNLIVPCRVVGAASESPTS